MSNRPLRGYCVVFVASVALVGMAAASNIVENGSFEQPAVTDSHDWDIYTSITGWQLSRGPSIEIQSGVNGWLAADGSQYVELDSDIDGPGGGMNNDNASSAIYQDLLTTPGLDYELTFALSPRPGVSDNALEIVWDGMVVDTLIASGLGLSNTNWQYHTYVLSATGTTTRLQFGDRGVSNSLGTFLDDVAVTPIAIPEPTGVVMLALGAAFGLMRRR